jgi:hypothetical protein
MPKDNYKLQFSLKGGTQRELTTEEVKNISRNTRGVRSPMAREEKLSGVKAPITELTRTRYSEGYEEGLRVGMARVENNFDTYDVVVSATLVGYKDGVPTQAIKFASTLPGVVFSLRETTSKMDETSFKLTELKVSVDDKPITRFNQPIKDLLVKFANWTSANHGDYAIESERLSNQIASYAISKHTPSITNNAEIDWVYVAELLDKKDQGTLVKAEARLLEAYAPAIEERLNAELGGPKR